MRSGILDDSLATEVVLLRKLLIISDFVVNDFSDFKPYFASRRFASLGRK
jgi:hypothetical protein